MTPAPDHNDLLADVLAEGDPRQWRARLLEETLRLAGRKRQVRLIKRGALIALPILGVIGILLWRNPTGSPVTAVVPAASFATVRTQPLAADAIVVTRRLPVGAIVSSVASVQTVHTDPIGVGRLLSDLQLLALVDSRPVVLVRRGPGSAELIFINPADRKGFPVN